MNAKKTPILAWILIGLVLVYILLQTGFTNPFRTLSTVETGGHPKLGVIPERISDDTEIYPGKSYKLTGNAHFRVPLTVDGAGQWVAGIWKALMDHYGVIPYYWQIEYYYIITKQGYPEGEWEWFISGTFEFTPVKSESIVAVLLILLTTWQFWLGVGMTASLLILAIGFTAYILKPIGEAGPDYALVALIAILGAAVLVVVFSGGRKRRR